VNPNIVTMQLESAIGFGLSAALSGAITFKDGRIEQGNFHEYPVVRMNQMPRCKCGSSTPAPGSRAALASRAFR